jgi:GT2 family glycosyltransferase
LKTRDLSIVICAYTEERWEDLSATVESLWQQTLTPREVIVVIDHNPELLARACQNLHGVRVIENQEQLGLSGARNSGTKAAQGEAIAFLDDDVIASASWLERLSQGYRDRSVCGVGGAIRPMWADRRPGWFPEEFDWIIGCTYRGMPQEPAAVRNLIGANMSFRRELLLDMGGFRAEIGQVGTDMHRCDDTEFCIRVGQQRPQLFFYYEPSAVVFHRVPVSRTRWKYFQARCFTEGQTKARLTGMLGARSSLASERVYAWRTLPGGVIRAMADFFFTADLNGLGRAGAIGAGFALTTLGYLSGLIGIRSRDLRNFLRPSHSRGLYPP